MIRTLAERYLTEKRVAVPTLESWRVLRSKLGVFLDFLAEAEIAAPAELSPQLLTRFQTALFYRKTRFGKPPSSRFQASVLSQVRGFLQYLVREGYLLTNPAADLALPHLPRRLPPGGLSRSEAEKLVSAPDMQSVLGRRDRALLEVLYATGVRANELLSLALPDLGGTDEEPILRIKRGKGGKERIVPLGRPALAACRDYLERARPRMPNAQTSTLLFLSRRGKKLSDRVLNRLIARYSETAGIERHVTAHTLRHTCATLMLKAGCDIRYIQILLGHSSLTTTQLYTKVDISDLARAHARFHPRSVPRRATASPTKR